MEVTWDKSVDMGYIRLSAGDRTGIVSESIELDPEGDSSNTQIGCLTLDFDREGRLVGVEVHQPRRALHPSLLDTAHIIG